MFSEDCLYLMDSNLKKTPENDADQGEHTNGQKIL